MKYSYTLLKTEWRNKNELIDFILQLNSSQYEFPQMLTACVNFIIYLCQAFGGWRWIWVKKEKLLAENYINSNVIGSFETLICISAFD